MVSDVRNPSPHDVLLSYLIHLMTDPQSIEDIFLRDDKIHPDYREKFRNVGLTLSTEITSVKPRQHLQAQLDAFNILRSLRNLTAQLDELNLKQNGNSELLQHMKWKERQLDDGSRFWDTVHSDLPWHLGEGVRTSVRDRDVRTNPRVSKQMLTRHPKYRGMILVKDPFQCLHRGDGEPVNAFFNTPMTYF